MTDRPNLVLIVLDSVRRDHLSCYGYRRQTTPNIDAIAAEGVRFTLASAASCWTLPAHGSLFTGLYPSEHGVDLGSRRIRPGQETLASYLRRQGYATASITCNGFLADPDGLAEGYDVVRDVERLRGGGPALGSRMLRAVHRRCRALTRRDRGSARATDLALRWLKRQAGGGPFHLFINYMDCHLPYRLRRADRMRFVPPKARRRAWRVPQDPFAMMAGRLDLSPTELASLRDQYDGCLFYIDRQVGRLEHALQTLDLADDTILVITSDHGESFGEHGLMDHQYGLYEQLLAVPLIARWPDATVQGREDDRLAQHVDVLPTVMELLGDSAGAVATSGRSLLSGEPRAAAFAEYPVPNLGAFRRRFPDAEVARYDVALRSVRTRRHKLIRGDDGRIELYDLVADPAERENLATALPDLVESLDARLKRELGAWPARSAGRKSVEAGKGGGDAGGGGEMDGGDEMDAMRERLEALGYL